MAGTNVNDYHTLTVSTSAVGAANFSPAITQEAARRAVISVEDAALRYRDDGTDPTATEGHIVSPGTIIYAGDEIGDDYNQWLQAVKFIRKDGTDVKLKATTFKQ